MENFKVVIKKSAAKELGRINLPDRRRIIGKIRELANDQRPPGSKKLSGQEKYRVRQGNYRILYQIEADRLVIVVVKVGHRGDVYE